MIRFYQAGNFLENSPVSDLTLHAQIPDYTCPACGNDDITTNYSYPHLEIGEVVTKEERKKLGPVMRTRGNNEEIAEIVWRLRRKWNIAVSAGTIFGPTSLKVTTKPKADFYVLVNHAGFFCKHSAAEKLLQAGIAIEYVKTPARGKWASEADYVELAVPVLGNQKLPPGKSFCPECLRYRPGRSFRTILIEERLPCDRAFFKTIEAGVIIFSETFISTTKELGLTGFVEGKTLLPVTVAKEIEPWDETYKTREKERKAIAWQELLRKMEQ